MTQPSPSPQTIFETLTAYQKSAALAGAITLDLFTAIAAGATSIEALAKRCGVSDRGIRSLCDYLVATGFLEKRGRLYGLTAGAAAYLDRASDGYVGDAVEFLHSSELQGAFADVPGAVRRGGTVLEQDAFTGPDHPAWAAFARAMAPMATVLAQQLVAFIVGEGWTPGRVLDVSAGHGRYGIALATHWPETSVAFQDWPTVLAVAAEQARAAGLEGRYTLLPGSAFEVDLGGPYDTVLLPNFLHHFDRAACTALLRRLRAVLAPGGRIVAIEAVVDADRVSPAPAAAFGLVMLVTTPGGDVYTRTELEAMFHDAGFDRTVFRPFGEAHQQVIVSTLSNAHRSAIEPDLR